MAIDEPKPEDYDVWGFCYRCWSEKPLDKHKPGFTLATHAGRDGIKCGGSGRKAGYICAPPDEPSPTPETDR